MDRQAEEEIARQKKANEGVAGAKLRACPKCGLQIPFEHTECPVDGTPLPQEIVPGAMILDRYQLLSLLGGGGMGLVYRAKQVALDKDFAIKFLTTDRCNEKASRRFQVEAKAASRLDHLNIVRVSDFGLTASGCPF